MDNRALRGKWTQETCIGCPQQRYATGEPGKVQGRDRVEIVEEFWVLLSPLPSGGGDSGKICFIMPKGGKWTQETWVGCPQQQHATEEPGKVQGQDRVWIVEGSCVYLARGVSIRGKFVLSRNPEYKTRGGGRRKRRGLNVVLSPGWPTPKSKFWYGTYRCELWVLLPPLESVFGENSFYRVPGSKWAQKTCAGCPR